MTNSFGAYVKKARKEKPKTNHHDLPLPSQLEQEASIQQELSAQLSSLSTHSMRPVRKTTSALVRSTDDESPADGAATTRRAAASRGRITARGQGD